MVDIDSILDGILAREGGFVDNPADHGGATNLGVTQAELSAWLGRPATTDDVRSLSRDVAKAIYRQDYYHKPKIDQLPDSIQPVMLDAAVNSGPGEAVRFLQEVLNDQGYGLAVDVGIGPATLAAAAKADAALGKGLAGALIAKRRAFLQQLAVKDPSQQRFEAGWMARCDALAAQYA